MLSNPALKNRFAASGPLIENVHLVDLFLYDSSLFANVLIIEDTDSTLIVDTGTSKSVGSIKNYLHFNQIRLENVVIIPSHIHFDHFGGVAPLIEFIEERGGNVNLLLTEKQIQKMQELEEYKKKAEKAFSDTVGRLEPISDRYIEKIREDCTIELGTEWELKIIETPGHSPEHISPLLINGYGEKLFYFGEALGINLRNDLHPIPASSAPEFRLEDYKRSIKKIMEIEADMGIFAHFGGVQGHHSVLRTTRYALQSLEEFSRKIREYYEENPSTKYITEKIYQQYEQDIATLSINESLARSLTFTIVYGLLQELGLKKKK